MDLFGIQSAAIRLGDKNNMKAKGSDVKNFWQNFKKAAIESGVQDKIAEWYVNCRAWKGVLFKKVDFTVMKEYDEFTQV